jgi:hypothetical protein
MESQAGAVLEAAPAGETADISASLPEVGWPRLSRDGTLEGSLPATTRKPVNAGCPAGRARGRDVVGGTNAPSIRAITARRSLAPSSCTRRPVGVTHATLSVAVVSAGRRTAGLFRSLFRPMQGLGRASKPVALRPWWGTVESPRLATYLLVQACQQLWLVEHHGPCSTSLELTMPCAPGPRPPCAAGSRRRRSRFGDRPRRAEVTLLHGLQTKQLPAMPAVVGDP